MRWKDSSNKMKCYQLIVVVIMFLWNCLASAQVIQGVACDKTTGMPISNVHVYLDGTSINTITNSLGKFELRTNSAFNTRLVLNHLLYQTVIINNPFKDMPDTLYMEERIYDLPEVTIRADRFTREQKMKAFREQFLGVSRAGKSCVILNEDDIQLSFNMQTRRLLASSDNPIVVVNDAGLNSDYVQNSFFAVASYFVDKAPDSRRIKRRRDNIYELSANYFFKSFSSNSLNKNKFILFNKMYPIDHKQYFTVKDTLSLKMIRIIPYTDINKDKMYYSVPNLSGIIRVLFRRRIQSEICFITDSFLVDRYGNIDKIDQIFFSGQMGKNRAGDLLPIDYELKTEN